MIRNNKILTQSRRRFFFSERGFFVFTVLFLSFLSNSLFGQVIHNTGAKINVTKGTFVESDTLNNDSGKLLNRGIINLKGDFINADSTIGDGDYNLKGSWFNTGEFIEDTSTVRFLGNIEQIISSAATQNFYKLIIDNAGLFPINKIRLLNNVEVKYSLGFNQGNIDANSFKLYLSNQSIASLEYTSLTKSRIIGKFERGVSEIGEYLFPVGSDTFRNSLQLKINNAFTPGSVLSEFYKMDPGDMGLPVTDLSDSVEIYSAYNDGYWGLMAKNGFVNDNYSISLDAEGFDSTIYDLSRVIKRPVTGDWTVDGIHKDAVGTVVNRDNLTQEIVSTGIEYGIGHPRPKIWVQAPDTAVCEGEEARFSIYATGYGPLVYEWQIFNGSTWEKLVDDFNYSGTETNTLSILTNLSMNGNVYRVKVSHAHGYYNTSLTDSLTVNEIPFAIASVNFDTQCNNETTHIEITSTVLYSTFQLEVLSSANITGFSNTMTGDSIIQTLTNHGELIDSVVYIVTPKGPHTTFCVGIPDTVVIWVVPTLSDTAVPFEYNGGWNIACNNEENGRISLSPSGGYYLGDFKYTWTKDGLPFNQDGDTIDNLSIGEYVYRIEDDIGCSYIDTVTLYQPEAFSNNDSILNVYCEGYDEGKIFTDISGGTPVYDYTWRGPYPFPYGKNDSIVDISFGIYYLTLKDLNNCEYRDTFEVLAPFIVTINPVKSRYGDYNISCKGLSDGSIESRVNGTGSPDHYIYAWEDNYGNPVSSDIDLINVPAGSYILNVIDSIGCKANGEIELKEPDSIRIVRTGTKYDNDFDISCYGFSDGIINISVSLSHTDRQNLSFAWEKESDPDFTEISKDISGLTADKYTLTVTDTFNCVNSAEYFLVQPDEILLNVVDASDYNGYNISCNSLSDAYLDLTVSGGFGDFQYDWTTIDGSISEPTILDQNNIPAGHYTLKSTDEMECFKEWDFNISEPDSISIAPDLSAYHGFEISCFADSSGTIELNTAGGVNPYDYVWSGGNSVPDTEDQSGLIAGNYRVEVSDLNDCLASWDFVLSQPDSIITSITPKTVTCFGINNGAADLTVSGGLNPYTFLWSNGETTEDIDSLFIDQYIVEVRDLNNCLKTDSTLVTEPPEIIIELESPLKYFGRMISCNGESDADIYSVLSGGVGTYDYYWSNDSTSASLSNVGAGIYTLEVTDDNECSKIDSIEVFEPQKLITEVYTTDPTCFGKNDGSIALIIQGGTPEYSIIWNGLDQGGPSAEELYAGNHPISITDLNLCRIDTIAYLEQPDSMYIIKEIGKTFCPDISDGRIEIAVFGGTFPYEFNWSNGDEGANLDGLMTGTYILELSDQNQCVLYDTTYLESANISCLELFTAFTPNGDGYNDTWEIKNIELYPEATVEIFNRWGELMYRSDKGYDNPWDGTYKGRELPIDSYHFVINLGNGRDPFTGNVTIIR
jgi:gliding motility-associated-like protein